MKTALITTTINVPRVLELYRKLDPLVRFFVAGDHKTPKEAIDFISGLPECRYVTGEHYEHSNLIGWNTDSRRNIALLEALKWGAELIVSIDDDMIPEAEWRTLKGGYRCLDYFNATISYPFHGLQFGSKRQWIDAGNFTIPDARQRGLPLDTEVDPGFPTFVVDATIGVAQGIILGVPDTGAAEAITNTPIIHSSSDILRNGFVVHPEAYSVFNSQFTAFRRELAPAFAQYYKWQGRNTDIFASLLMRRIMQEKNLYTYFGPPMAFHARAPRPLFNDLKAEMWGLEHIADFADFLARAPLPAGASIVDWCRVLTEGYDKFSDENKACARAWYDDVERALG